MFCHNFILVIIKNADKKLEVTLEDGIGKLISQYTIEGRKAVNILADAYGYSLYNDNGEELKKHISLNDVEELAGQHTRETGQEFEAEALKKIYELTGGQPWLTNAL